MQTLPSVSQATRFERGRRVVQRASELLGIPLAPLDPLYNHRTTNRLHAWEIGAILFASRERDVEAAAQRLADALRSRHLEDVSGRAPMPMLDSFQQTLRPLDQATRGIETTHSWS